MHNAHTQIKQKHIKKFANKNKGEKERRYFMWAQVMLNQLVKSTTKWKNQEKSFFYVLGTDFDSDFDSFLALSQT